MEDVALQVKPEDCGVKGADRFDLIPFLLFFLILAIAYFGFLGSAGGGLPLFLVLALLNGGFLVWCLQLTGKIRKSQSEHEAELQDALRKISDRDHELRDHISEMSQLRSELNAGKQELDQANQLFDHYSLQLEVANSELGMMKSESEAILANVKQGVFLLTSDGTIGGQYSEEVKHIFQIEDAAARNFARLLRPLIPEKRHQTIQNYIDLLFNPKKNAVQLQKFNPLKCVELNFQRPEGGFAPKFVEFNFQRVMDGASIHRVLVTAVDITEHVQLEARLREGEERREKQLELLGDLLNAESSQLRGFLKDAEAVVTDVNNTFRSGSGEAPAETPQDKVARVFRMVHKLKSQAASLGLRLLEADIHQIEDLLNGLRRNSRVSNEDFLAVLVPISNFQGRLKESGELVERLSGFRRSFGGSGTEERLAPATPSAELMRAAEDLCRTVAARVEKKARIEWSVTGYDDLPLRYQTAIRDSAFQLVRNAITHGIERPADREAKGKDPCGLISITLKPVPECRAIHMTCRDDGKGLDVELIRAKAVREGMMSEAEAKVLPESEIYSLIFEPGFSTAAKVTEDAGRGVGLDALHDTISGQFKGEIQMEFGAGRYCQFELLLPLP